jgi:hypothetical protein
MRRQNFDMAVPAATEMVAAGNPGVRGRLLFRRDTADLIRRFHRRNSRGAWAKVEGVGISV